MIIVKFSKFALVYQSINQSINQLIFIAA